MAKLTKQQILFIENYLIELGVKYWDVRIELIDHIVSEIEDSTIHDFEQMVVDVTNKLGYKSYTVKKRLGEKAKELGKEYNKLLINKMKLFFVSKNTIVVAFLFITLFSVLFKELTDAVFVKVGLGVLLVPFMFLVGSSINQYRSIKKSIHLKTVCSVLSFPFLIFSIFFHFARIQDIQTILVFILVPILYYFAYCSYLVYKEVSNKHLKIYKELNAK